MPTIPLGKASYRRGNNAEIRLVNMAYEVDPTNVQDQVSLIARPGLQAWATPGSTPVRGLHRFDAGGSSGFIVAVTDRVYGYADNGSPFAYASNYLPGTGNCTFASLGDLTLLTALVCNGAGLYTWGFSTSALAFPDSASVTSVDVIANRFVATRGGSGRFYWTDLGTTNFDALNYATAENGPDNLVALKATTDELWLFGSASIEAWAPAGDPDLPFQKIGGRSFGIGLLSRSALCKVGDTIMFIGAQERKAFAIAPNPVPVSDPDIEARLAQAAVAEINVFGVQADGHDYFVVNMGSQGTAAYDPNTRQWSEWGTQGANDFQGRYSAPMGDGRYLIGSVGGKLYVVNPLKYTDDGTPIERRATGYLVAPPRTRVDNLILECTVGQAATYPENPVVAMEFSDDLGKTWSEPETASLGHRGEFDALPVWTRLGPIMGRDGRIFSLTCAEDLPVTFRALSYNERP